MRKTTLFIIVIITIGLLPSWIQYGGLVMLGDFITQQVPFIIETKRMLSSGVPFWSWNTYFGDNFWGAYSFYTISSPFVWLNCLFPTEYVFHSIVITLYLKLISLGAISYKFFRKVKISEQNAVLGSLLFTFSSYVLIDLCYYHFVEPIICFVLLLYSIEKCISKEKYGVGLLCLCSFAVFFVNFYFAPCSFIPAFIYTIFRLREDPDRSSVIKPILRAIPIIVIGALMSAVLLYPTLLHLSGNSRAEEDSILAGYNIQERLISLLTPKLKDGVIPLTHDTAWTSTAGHIPVFGFLLALLYCWRYRNSIFYTLFTLLLFYLTPLNGVFSLFTDPNYTRWAYALTFFITIASIKYLDAKEAIKRKDVILYTLGCLLLLLWRYATPIAQRLIHHRPFYEDQLSYTVLTIVICLISCILLYYLQKKPRFALVLVAGFATIHLATSLFIRTDFYVANFQKDYKKTEMYQMYVKDNSLPYNKATNNFRTDFLTRFQPYFYANIGLLRNVPSVNTYHSISNTKIQSLLSIADSHAVRLKSGITKDCNQTTFNCLMSVKEIIQYKDPDSTTELCVPCIQTEENDSYRRLQPQYYIPFGFTYDSYVLQEEIDKKNEIMPKLDIPGYLLENIAIRDEDVPALSPYLSRGNITEICDLDSIVTQRNHITADHTNWNTSGFNCDIAMERDNLVFFSVPADPGFTATIDGIETRIFEVNCGLSGIIVPKGTHHIQFSFIPNGFKAGLIISLFALAASICLVCLSKNRIFL